MAKFRRKPIVIEAVKWTGLNIETMKKFMGVIAINFGKLVVSTLEGDMKADIGDWVIKGVKGEFHPCKPDIFAATYEAVEDAGNGE